MFNVARSRLFQKRLAVLNSRRLVSSRTVHPTAQHIRQQFLDYFVNENDHNFVRSSPVVPFCDPTVAFVNAGMNQFKNVFLDAAEPRFLRVANTQKCVRVGGKHNDLSVVGTDGYHHTFFEMMGNWSFGSYFKHEACQYAWNLLTGPYRIDPNRLYVTYFAGDKALGIEADLECRDIWRSLGLPDERILPFGIADNFWEMGSTGPCGPCTEIHYDHCPVSSRSIGDVQARARLVNAGLPELTEIWNLVFIQYNRNSGNVITALPKKHVDTGMGMERLTAVLQNASSNYTTDLFLPIFDHIYKTTNVAPYEDRYDVHNDKYDLYTAYRIVADHSRMITACLSDGMIPGQNHKLRRAIRKVFAISKNAFAYPELLPTIIPRIVEKLGPTYPEMWRNQSQIQSILENERELYRALKNEATTELDEILLKHPQLADTDIIDATGFVPAFREYQTLTANLNKDTDLVPGEFLFKMYDTFGLREEQIEQLLEMQNVKFDRGGFEKCLKETRNRTRSLFVLNESVGRNVEDSITDGHAYTENELKYNYRFNYANREYSTPKIRVKVLAVSKSSVEDRYDVVLDQSTFYPKGGGQESDQGTLAVETNKLVSDIKVTDVRMGRGGVLVHSVVRMKSEPFLKVGDTVEIRIDNKRRTANIFHHTATHILNACVKRITNSVTYQLSSTVSYTGLKLELAILGKKLDTHAVRQIHELVQNVIDAGNVVRTDVVDSQAFYTLDGITRIPGEIYPDRNVRIVSIVDPRNGITSREPCCGTHAVNTRELEYFCITNIRHTGRGSYQFSAVSGRQAKVALEVGDQLLQLINKLGTCTDSTASDSILKKILHLTAPQMNVPHHIRLDCQEILNSAARLKREVSKTTLKEYVDQEIQELLSRSSKHPFIVHILSDIPNTLNTTESVPLQRATKMCSDRPILVACLFDGCVRARCAVPRHLVSDQFGAQQWLQTFASVFNGQIGEPQQGQNPEEISVMKARKVPPDEFEELIQEAVRVAEKFAEQRVSGKFLGEDCQRA